MEKAIFYLMGLWASSSSQLDARDVPQETEKKKGTTSL
jgi:hypothetical protein